MLAICTLVLTKLFSAAVNRDSVSFLKFPYLNNVQVISITIFVYQMKYREWIFFPCPLSRCSY